MGHAAENTESKPVFIALSAMAVLLVLFALTRDAKDQSSKRRATADRKPVSLTLAKPDLTALLKASKETQPSPTAQKSATEQPTRDINVAKSREISPIKQEARAVTTPPPETERNQGDIAQNPAKVDNAETGHLPLPERPNEAERFLAEMKRLGIRDVNGVITMPAREVTEAEILLARLRSETNSNARNLLSQSAIGYYDWTWDEQSWGGSPYYDFNYRPGVGVHYQNGYIRRDGTFVSGHFKTNSDNSFWNNYSSKGNLNPHTGKIGTKLPPVFGKSGKR